MSRRFLIGAAAVATPRQARALYRHPRWRLLALDRAIACALSPTPMEERFVADLFVQLKRRFRWRAERRDVWGNAVETARWIAGRWLRMAFGDCDDFAVMLLAALVRAGIPRGACRLCQCQVPVPGAGRGDTMIGHLVLVVATEAGSLVCDQRQARPLWADNLVFAGYAWHAIEDPPAKPGAPARWVSLRPAPTLAALAEAAKDG